MRTLLISRIARHVMPALLATMLGACQPSLGSAQGGNRAVWDSVGRVLKSPPVPSPDYMRYNFPRRDITLTVGGVTVAPALALGTWAGFSGPPTDAMLMGDLVLLAGELKPVLAELNRQHLGVAAIHNHLAGESPPLVFVHYHGEGNATDLARRLDLVLARTATPRPVTASPPPPVTIDTATVFKTLGLHGRAQGNVAQVSTNLVNGPVTVNGRVVNPAMAYGTPINIQMVSADRAVATGDFAVPGTREEAVVRALTEGGITATAVHTHLVGEEPQLRYIHFWADGPLPEVLRGLRAALDAAKP